MSSTMQSKLRIVMFPWLAHGHVSPFLELAKELSQRNFYIYFCSTPTILNFIKERITNYTSIELVELNLQSTLDLHTTKGLQPQLVPTLMKHFQDSTTSFSLLLEKIQPDLIIYDMMGHWIPPLASSLNIPSVRFTVSSATATSFFLHLLKRQGTEFPFPNISHSDCHHADKFIPGKKHEETSKVNPVFSPEKIISCYEMSHSIILIKACKVLEEKYIDYFSSLTGKKSVPVGSLLSPNPKNKEHEEEQTKVVQWLDKKDPFSCVYISFGSECYLSKEDLEELAYGLELVSDVNFIWVVRFLSGEKKMNVEEALPEGFIERIGERGMIIDGWAPQEKILGHAHVVGHVSHCGWGSTLESIYFGVPIIAMPMQHEQPITARLVEEGGVGVEVLRDENGNYKREAIAKVIKEVVVEKSSGEEIRRRTKEASEKLRVEGDEAPNKVAEELKKLCEMNIGKSANL